MPKVICPDCNKTRIPTREQIIAKEYCRCFAKLENFAAVGELPRIVIKERPSSQPIEPEPPCSVQIDNLGTVTCRHSGTFSNGEFSLRFEPASNGEADRCDIVVFNSEGDVERHKNLIMECLHEGTKVYSGGSWICSMCGELGGAPLENEPEPDGSDFRRLWKLSGR